MNMPITNSTRKMQPSITSPSTSNPVAHSTTPREAPEKARSCEKVVEATMMVSIMTETESVPRKDFTITDHESFR